MQVSEDKRSDVEEERCALKSESGRNRRLFSSQLLAGRPTVYRATFTQFVAAARCRMVALNQERRPLTCRVDAPVRCAFVARQDVESRRPLWGRGSSKAAVAASLSAAERVLSCSVDRAVLSCTSAVRREVSCASRCCRCLHAASTIRRRGQHIAETGKEKQQSSTPLRPLCTSQHGSRARTGASMASLMKMRRRPVQCRLSLASHRANL
jgi:hypothetical protein